MNRTVRLLAPFLCVFFCAGICAAETSTPRRVTLLPLWLHQAQFAGYYTALDKGIYARHNIDATIVTGGPQRPPEQYLREGKADFAVLWLDQAIEARTSGLALVNVAQIVQRSGLMLVAKKSSGIEAISDLDGKKVGIWDGGLSIQPKAFFNWCNVSVKEVSQSGSVNLFLRDGVQATSAMWYNEYHTILNSGLNPDELTTFFFHEYGFNFPEDGIYCLESTYRKDPELCADFARASIEGWEYAFSHPEEALEAVLKRMEADHLPANRVHQQWMLARMKDLIWPERPEDIGLLDPSDFERVAYVLKENGLIREAPSYESFAPPMRKYEK